MVKNELKCTYCFCVYLTSFPSPPPFPNGFSVPPLQVNVHCIIPITVKKSNHLNTFKVVFFPPIASLRHIRFPNSIQQQRLFQRCTAIRGNFLHLIIGIICTLCRIWYDFSQSDGLIQEHFIEQFVVTTFPVDKIPPLNNRRARYPKIFSTTIFCRLALFKETQKAIEANLDGWLASPGWSQTVISSACGHFSRLEGVSYLTGIYPHTLIVSWAKIVIIFDISKNDAVYFIITPHRLFEPYELFSSATRQRNILNATLHSDHGQRTPSCFFSIASQ